MLAGEVTEKEIGARRGTGEVGIEGGTKGETRGVGSFPRPRGLETPHKTEDPRMVRQILKTHS